MCALMWKSLMEKECPLWRLMDKEKEEEGVDLYDKMQPLKSSIEEKLICLWRYNGLDNVTFFRSKSYS